MRRKTRLILLTLIGTMIILLIALGFSYAYMKGLIGDGAKSSLSVNNCAKILLTESGSSINLSNTYPMSDNAGLNTTPYTFGIRSTCSGNRGFKLYIVTIAGNTLSANNVKYALTLKGSKEILTSGKIGSLSSGSSDFNTSATNQLSSKVGTVDSIYYTYEDNIALGEVTYYDLYMWVDKDATTSVANKSFTAAVTVLEGEYETSDITLRLAGDITTYDANVSCSGATGAKWNPLNRSVEVLDITKTTARCNVSNKTNTNLGNLKDIVEGANDVYEETGVGNYVAISYDKYILTTPFYTTSLSTSVTSGTDEAGAITWDSTNSYWSTSPIEVDKYYYYLFKVTESGYYELCARKSTDGNYSSFYRYKNTTNMFPLTLGIGTPIVNYTEERCYSLGYVNSTDTIRLVERMTSTTPGNIVLYLKKSNSNISAGYRYESKNPNNYVWFNNEMWRIIGSIPTKIDIGGTTTTTNLVKIIRSQPLNGIVKDSSSSITNWNEATLYTLLNSYYYGRLDATDTDYCYFYQADIKTNCDYRNIGIDENGYYGSMIKTVYWNTGRTIKLIAPDVAYGEETYEQTISGHVGIMNASDYGFAASYNRPNRTAIMSYNTANYTASNWLYGQGDEYTLTQVDVDSLIIENNGAITMKYNHLGNVIRPVVYLDSTVYVVSGDGSILNPYKLGM